MKSYEIAFLVALSIWSVMILNSVKKTERFVERIAERLEVKE